MSPALSVPRVVLDTDLVLCALVFGGGKSGALRLAWQEGRILPLIATPAADELLRALGYPKFGLSAAEQEELLTDFLAWCETASSPSFPRSAWECGPGRSSGPSRDLTLEHRQPAPTQECGSQ